MGFFPRPSCSAPGDLKSKRSSITITTKRCTLFWSVAWNEPLVGRSCVSSAVPIAIYYCQLSFTHFPQQNACFQQIESRITTGALSVQKT